MDNIKIEEVWKKIPGFPDYKVSSLGRVLSTRTSKQKFLVPSVIRNPRNKKFYRHVTLQSPYITGKPTSIEVHILIMNAFRGYTPEGYYIRFKNGDTLDPKLDNLEFVEYSIPRYKGVSGKHI